MSQGMVQMKIGLVGLGRMGAAMRSGSPSAAAKLPGDFREFMPQAYQ